MSFAVSCIFRFFSARLWDLLDKMHFFSTANFCLICIQLLGYSVVSLLGTVHPTPVIGNPERHLRKASHRGSKQQWRSCVAISLTIACLRHAYIFLFFAHIPFVVNQTINATPPERLQHYLRCHAHGKVRSPNVARFNL